MRRRPVRGGAVSWKRMGAIGAALCAGVGLALAAWNALPKSASAGARPAVAGAAPAVKPVWPQWRGPQRDGKSTEKGLLQSWGPDEPPRIWTARGFGSAYSSVAIHDGKLYTLGRTGGATKLIAADLADGGVAWSTPITTRGDSPNSTPTVDVETGLVYGLGHDGTLVCADAASGEIVWKKSLPHDLGGEMMSGWGYSESPLIDGDLLICTPGGENSMLAALDKKTGEAVWTTSARDLGRRGRDGAGYSSPVVSNAAGVKQYVQLVGRGVVGVDAKTGKLLWSYNGVANGTANIPTPIADGTFVFCSSGYGTGAALLEIRRNGSDLSAREVYFLDSGKFQNHHGGMILLDGHVYAGHGHNQGFPICVELATGKVKWRKDRGPGSGSAAVTYADGNLIFRYESGQVALIEATATGYNERGVFHGPSEGGPAWAHPVVADGRLYLRQQDEIACYDIKRP